MVFRTPSLAPSLKSRDEQLLEEWRSASGFQKDQKLEELMQALSGAINQAVNTYRGAPLPFSTLELEAKRLAVQALREWDPTKGASISSYVTGLIKQRLYRYVTTYQNSARIPEHQTRMIGQYQRAVEDLTSRFGSEPSTTQLADYMQMPVKQIASLRKSLRQDLLESQSDDLALEDHSHDPDFERVSLAYYSLSNQEKKVYDYLLGAHGQPRLAPKQIAARLGISPARVTKVKTTIAQKLSPYLG